MRLSLKQGISMAVALLIWSISTVHAAIDLDNNGHSDIWEMLFAAEGLASLVDTDGDSVPEYTPAYDQADIESFMTQFVTTDNKVTLGSQDVIYLFELGTRNTSASYFDMQDLVTIVTFTEVE